MAGQDPRTATSNSARSPQCLSIHPDAPFIAEVVPSRPEHLALLPAIEQSAAQLFSTVPAAAFLASEPPTPESEFRRFHESGMLWVLCVRRRRHHDDDDDKGDGGRDGDDVGCGVDGVQEHQLSHHHQQQQQQQQPEPVGFIMARRVGRYMHVVEMDVAREWQGRGLARMLMAHAEDALLATATAEVGTAAAEGLSLTTSRLTPWSFHWYRRLGFVETEPEEAGPEFVEMVAGERALWPGPFGDSRTLMVKRRRSGDAT